MIKADTANGVKGKSPPGPSGLTTSQVLDDQSPSPQEESQTQLSFHGSSDGRRCPLSSHGLPPLHGGGGSCRRDALVAVRLLGVLAVLRLGAILRVGLLPQRPVLLLLQLQVRAGEGVKDGRDGESHEQDAAEDAAERHHLAGDAPWHHVAVAHCGHGDYSPPVATWDAGELLLGAHLALGEEHQRREQGHGDAEEEQQEAELSRAPLDRQAQRLQAEGVAGKPHDVEDPQRPQDPQHQAHLLQVVVPRAGRLAPHRQGVHDEGDVVGQNGHHVDDVEGRAQEHALALRLDEAKQELQGEPGHAYRLQHEDVEAPLGALALRNDGGKRGLRTHTGWTIGRQQMHPRE